MGDKDKDSPAVCTIMNGITAAETNGEFAAFLLSGVVGCGKTKTINDIGRKRLAFFWSTYPRRRFTCRFLIDGVKKNIEAVNDGNSFPEDARVKIIRKIESSIATELLGLVFLKKNFGDYLTPARFVEYQTFEAYDELLRTIMEYLKAQVKGHSFEWAMKWFRKTFGNENLIVMMDETSQPFILHPAIVLTFCHTQYHPTNPSEARKTHSNFSQSVV